jgi:hypothetical protein
MNVQRLAAVASVAVVAAAVVAGLWLSGSPAEQRLLRLDESRVRDLRELSRAVYYRWEERQVLAATADELVDGRALSRLPMDPASQEPYEYRVKGAREFEVCAVFSRPARPEDAEDFWYHDVGRRCFEFDVTQQDRDDDDEP